ncbi:hypothetical protein PAPYR_3964 [Paratrimastix pyriformis]|uniref:KxDL domain-containing protein n=1 Tax=Paratrimastix pyriformis TaxID=342808 RepID=A0ABQ8UQS7_9EUKA|nr:hypothetical protein PAPYR_3964 [Paratrimastix pyriformis]
MATEQQKASFEKLRALAAERPVKTPDLKKQLREISDGILSSRPLAQFDEETGATTIVFQLLNDNDTPDCDSDVCVLLCEILGKLFRAPDAASFLTLEKTWPTLLRGINHTESAVRTCAFSAFRRCITPDAPTPASTATAGGATTPAPTCPLLLHPQDVTTMLVEGLRDPASDTMCAAVNAGAEMGTAGIPAALDFLTQPGLVDALLTSAPIPALDMYTKIAAHSPAHFQAVARTRVMAALSQAAAPSQEDILSAINALELMKRVAIHADGVRALSESGCLRAALGHLRALEVAAPTAMELITASLPHNGLTPEEVRPLVEGAMLALGNTPDPIILASAIQALSTSMLRRVGVEALAAAAPLPAGVPDADKAGFPPGVMAARLVGAQLKMQADPGVTCAVFAALRDLAAGGSPLAEALFLSVGLTHPERAPLARPLDEDRVVSGGPLHVMMACARIPEPLPRTLANQALAAMCAFPWFVSLVATDQAFVEWATDPRRMLDMDGTRTQKGFIAALLDSPHAHLIPLQLRTLAIRRKHDLIDEKEAPKVTCPLPPSDSGSVTFAREIVGIVNKEDTNKIRIIQADLLHKMRSANASLDEFNLDTCKTLPIVEQSVQAYANEIRDLKRNIEDTFRRIRSLRDRLASQYPSYCPAQSEATLAAAARLAPSPLESSNNRCKHRGWRLLGC